MKILSVRKQINPTYTVKFQGKNKIDTYRREGPNGWEWLSHSGHWCPITDYADLENQFQEFMLSRDVGRILRSDGDHFRRRSDGYWAILNTEGYWEGMPSTSSIHDQLNEESKRQWTP